MSYILSVLWGFLVPLEFIGLTFTNTEYFPSHIYVTDLYLLNSTT